MLDVNKEAAELVAKSDGSDPPNWRLDEAILALEQKLFRGAVQQCAVFAQICAIAATMLTGEASLLCLLGQINGLRRITTTPEEVAQVMALFAQVKASTDALEASSRKDRLVSFRMYQAGVFMARNGNYREAAEAEEYAEEHNYKDADRDPEQKAKRAISKFLVDAYTMWAMFTEGADKSVVYSQVTRVMVEFNFLEIDVSGTKHENSWRFGNGPFHLVVMWLLAGIEIPESDMANMQRMLRMAAEKEAVYEDAARFVEGLPTMNFTVGLFTDPAVVAMTRMVLARAARAEGRTTDAAMLYGLIEPAPDLRYIAAVAARELAAMNSGRPYLL